MPTSGSVAPGSEHFRGLILLAAASDPVVVTQPVVGGLGDGDDLDGQGGSEDPGVTESVGHRPVAT